MVDVPREMRHRENLGDDQSDSVSETESVFDRADGSWFTAALSAMEL